MFEASVFIKRLDELKETAEKEVPRGRQVGRRFGL